MDGYHLTRAQLSAMPDPAHAHARRGAAFTFDGTSFLSLIEKIREPISPSTLIIRNDSHLHAHHAPMQGVTSKETHFQYVCDGDPLHYCQRSE